MKSINDIGDIDSNLLIKKYKFQPTLTPILDELKGNFDQGIINQIVLWKVNRYSKIDPNTLLLLNQITKDQEDIDIEFSRLILEHLLNQKGIRLAMASTILRFKNPKIYQIIDQRVYRFVMKDLMPSSSLSKEAQINSYLSYLIELKKVCKERNIKFEDSDRIFYVLDKELNSDFKLKN